MKNWDALRLFSINRWPEKLGAIHGVDHWDRVSNFGQILFHEEADVDVIMAFAYLHDSERENNAEDPDHGLRASKLIDAIRTTELKELNDEQIEKLKRACELHTIQHSTGDPTIDICFDADRMDLLRVGIMPLPERMATKQGAEMVGNPHYKELYYQFFEKNNYTVERIERKMEVKIQENIPDSPYTNAAKALGNALISGDFDEFESLLNEKVENIVYSKETHKGKNATIDYWRGWRSRYVETNKAKSFEVVFSNYYSNACLLMEMMVVMFLIKDGKITKILMMQRHLNPTICHHDDILDFTFDLKSLESCLSELRESNEIFEPVIKENRMPCLTCGKQSEELEWYSSLIQSGIHGYSSIVSVCPHCHKVVEYYPEMRSRYIEPIDPQEAKYPIPHHPNKKDYIAIDKGNLFASKAKEYHLRIKNLESLKKKGYDDVFYDLDALSLEDGYHMGLRTAEQSGMGDESNFYVYDKNNQEDRDILKYIHVDETPMGAWQVYLLMTSPTLLPTFWHGGYIERTFILKGDELYDVKALNSYDLSDLLKQKMLYPEVVFETNSGIITAHVYCCYWNEWEGLVREHIELQINNGKVISYKDKGKFVIYKYHCGIYF